MRKKNSSSLLPELSWQQIVALLLFCVGLMLQIRPSNGFDFEQISFLQTTKIKIPDIETVPVAQAATDQLTADDLANQLSAQAAVVIDEQTGSILFSKNHQQPLPPASTTKLLTALVARDLYPLTEVHTIYEEAFTQGFVIGLQQGEQMSVQNLLAGLLINSGNDAAFTLANNHPQGYLGFVQAMNDKAAELGLERSFFSNPSGLDAPNHQTTAFVIALMLREVAKDEVLADYFSQESLIITGEAGRQYYLTNTHQLLATDPNVIGGKTGTTAAAGEVLATMYERDGHRLNIVVMGSLDRYGETEQLIDWVYQHYDWVAVDL